MTHGAVLWNMLRMGQELVIIKANIYLGPTRGQPQF